MTIHEATIAKIRRMPEPLVQELQDYADYLLARSDTRRWQAVQHLSECATLTESDMTDYLPGLEEYEDHLAHGDVKW